jgi:hypothetical protein
VWMKVCGKKDLGISQVVVWLEMGRDVWMERVGDDEVCEEVWGLGRGGKKCVVQTWVEMCGWKGW